MNYEKLILKVVSLAEETGKFILGESAHLKSDDIILKGVNNFVTYVDRGSEERLVAGLEKLLPGSGFIAEENSDRTMKEFTWIIDPLDGTTNYIHGIPVFSISIALMEQEDIIAGVVYEINQKERFYTWKGASSYLNGQQIHVSDRKSISDSLFATGFPYYDYTWIKEYLDLFRHLMQHSSGIRRLGSAAADMAWVACGRFDGFFEYGLNPWDVAAGSILVQNAGGLVTDFRGKSNYLFGKEIIATNTHIQSDFISLFKTWSRE